MKDTKNKTKTFELNFSECEHWGDIERFKEDLEKSDKFSNLNDCLSQPFDACCGEGPEEGKIRVDFAGSKDEVYEELKAVDLYGFVHYVSEIKS
jgi:hypothetical protein